MLNLTLTNVVFEFEIVLIFYKRLWHLTLTNVVFEFDKKFRISAGFDYLTLTNVVFEFPHSNIYTFKVVLFNFNKCCI